MPLVLTALQGLPMVAPGDDLSALILTALANAGLGLQDGDIVVLAQKIVSKAEGRAVELTTVAPGTRAHELAAITGKDARVLELVLQESKSVLRARPGTIIVEHRLGFICANAGIDHSNVAGGANTVLLLPVDPDKSAAQIRFGLERASGVRIGVAIIDSHGRAWRLGTVGVCIGISGVPSIIDERGWKDLFGYTLQTTIVGVADELAAGASLLMGQSAEGTPVVLVRGFPYQLAEARMESMLRKPEEDLFRK